MGLDMYLKAELYINGYEHNAKRPEFKIFNKVVKLLKVEDLYDKSTPSGTVNFIVAYWRKVNWLHGWFVENCQNGNDDCGSYYVDREQLAELVADCSAVIADHSLNEELLPTAEGFFFGGTDYDEYYWKELEAVRNTIYSLLEKIPAEYDFKYSSSW